MGVAHYITNVVSALSPPPSLSLIHINPTCYICNTTLINVYLFCVGKKTLWRSRPRFGVITCKTDILIRLPKWVQTKDSKSCKDGGQKTWWGASLMGLPSDTSSLLVCFFCDRIFSAAAPETEIQMLPEQGTSLRMPPAVSTAHSGWMTCFTLTKITSCENYFLPQTLIAWQSRL